MAITSKEIEELEEKRRQLDIKLKMHASSMGGGGFGAYRRKQEQKSKIEEKKDKLEIKVLEEVVKEVSKPDSQPDTQYELTPKALEMASKISSTKGVTNLVSNPIAAAITGSSETADEEPSQPKSVKTKSTPTRSSSGRKKRNKDPNYSTTTPGMARPLRVGDSSADILGKMYNFMMLKFFADYKQSKKDAKYRKMLHDVKERRIEQLINLFGGKYKKKTQKTDKELLKGKKQGIIGTVTDKIKDIIKSIVGGIGKTISGLGLGTAIVGEEIAGTAAVSTAAKTVIATGLGLAPLLAKGEAVSYDTAVGNQKTPKPLTEMTLDEVSAWQRTSKIAGGAAGKYQIVRGTLNEAKNKLGLKGDEKFTPELQDKIFSEFLIGNKKVGREKLSAYLSGQSDDLMSAQLQLSQEFASIPVPFDVQRPKGAGGAKDPGGFVKKGQSYYEGFNGNKASKSMTQEEVQKRLKEQRELNIGKIQPTDNTSAPNIKLTPAPSNKSSIPTKISGATNSGGTSVSVLNNNTNIINGSTNMAVISGDNTSYPTLIEKQYYSYG
jgi:hypothetical protein